MTETFIKISYMAYVTETATRTQTMQQIELPRLVLSHFYLVHCLLTRPDMLTNPQEFLERTSMEGSNVSCSTGDQSTHGTSDIDSFEEALRIAGLLFFKLVKGGSRESWDQHVSHLWLLNGHLRRILEQLKASRQTQAGSGSLLHPHPMAAYASEVEMLRFARGLLVWIALIGEAFSAASDTEAWQWPPLYAHDRTVYREFLAELLEYDGEDISANLLADHELDFCCIFHLGIMRNFVWDVRAEVTRVLRGRS